MRTIVLIAPRARRGDRLPAVVEVYGGSYRHWDGYSSGIAGRCIG